ncbi:MAG: propionyl-CoA carboxylase, partial [Deltaproteobacteria bacterium]|nr:propionyl-CoA carboxylase [Deltaproteobacteria bacterium]
GRGTVRERIDALADPGSFQEEGPIAGQSDFDGDGQLVEFTPANYVLGIARVDDRPVVVGGEDFTLKGGSPSPAGLRKSIWSEDLALRYRLPLVRFLEGGGGSVTGARSKGAPRPMGDPAGAQHRFVSIARVMGAVPVVSAAMGPVAGFPAARLVASHFSVMTRDTAQILVGGPALVERALGEKKTKEELGGADVHLKNGVVDNVAADEADAVAQVRRFLSYLPTNVWELAPRAETGDAPDRREEALLGIIPRDRRRIFDVRKMIGLVVDTGSFFEIGSASGRGQVTGLARVDGHSVGILGNDSRFYAGAMTDDGARKVRRFVDLCDTFHLPIVSFVDEPGFMIGSEAERAGTIRYGAQTLFAVVQSTVPWISIHVRKAFGVAAAAHFGPNGRVLAWPSAERGALPLEGGVAVAFHREIAEAEDPQARRDELERELASRRRPHAAAEAFAIHDMIDPRDTRPEIARWLSLLGPQLEPQRGPRQYTVRP